MIAGKPPFNGENHIDLLRNIQRKAVRLPPDVRVSKACVNLLRLLLNRNPLSRAGFKEFFEACDAFVSLGCEGVGTNETAGSCRIPGANDLGTIPENDNGNGSSSGGSPNSSSGSPPSESLITMNATAQQQQQHQLQQPQQQELQMLHQDMLGNPSQQQQQPMSAPMAGGQGTAMSAAGTNIVSPVLAPASAPTSLAPNVNLYDPRAYPTGVTVMRNRLSPLTQSPPSSGPVFHDSRIPVSFPSLGTPAMTASQHGATTNTYTTSTGLVHANSVSQSQASAGEDSFVLVEHSTGQSSSGIRNRNSPNSSQHYYVTTPPTLSSFGSGVPQNSTYQLNMGGAEADPSQLSNRRSSKGMLSTSPGTGKMLLGMVGRALPLAREDHSVSKLGEKMATATKMIATAEDVGRRAVSVAHLGDTRAYLGMRLIFRNAEEGSSLLSSTPMEGVEEEPCEDRASNDNSGSTEIMAARRRSSTTSDKQMAEMCADVDQGDEMPFAITPEAPAVSLPSRSNMSAYNRSTNIVSSMKKSTVKADPQTIRSCFAEALSCYLKALKMLKGAVGAAQRVSKDLERLETQMGRSSTEFDVPKMKRRCEVTGNWLCAQFRGVLERADAANVEISKLLSTSRQNEQNFSFEAKEASAPNAVSCVEELIYNQALASGRDGAVKHLLGQFDAARSCYRSAGLLAETLLMEANVGAEDRKILEGYVDGFAARITELDQLMIHQSRATMAATTNTASAAATPSSSRRGSGVVGLIGPPPSAPTGFLVGSTR